MSPAARARRFDGRALDSESRETVACQREDGELAQLRTENTEFRRRLQEMHKFAVAQTLELARVGEERVRLIGELDEASLREARREAQWHRQMDELEAMAPQISEVKAFADRSRRTLSDTAAANAEKGRADDERDLPRVVALFQAKDARGRLRHVVKTVAEETGFSKERVTRIRKLARERGLLPRSARELRKLAVAALPSPAGPARS